MTGGWDGGALGWFRQRTRRERFAALSHRTRQVLLLAGITGAVTGLAIAAFDLVVREVLLAHVVRWPLAVQAAAPTVGLILAAVLLRTARPPISPATSDDYIRAFHHMGGAMDLRHIPRRMLAAVATLGFGNPLGYEGPSLYAGASIGELVQRRFRRFFGPGDVNVLLVAGAAAGVAAIFKAPVTGIVFALEVPYQEDLARRMLLPAAIGAAASYVTFAALAGTEPLLPVSGQPPFNLVDLGGAAVVGLVAGVLARTFAGLLRHAKAVATQGRVVLRVAAAGSVLAATVLLAELIGDSQLVLGPGYDALSWAVDPDRSVLAIVALGTLRVLATLAVVGGGGVGGLFIPLVIQGALVGQAVGGVFETETSTLFPVVGMAAFLGAGYRVPLAAVVFVAEFTGRPGFVVPGLIAAVVSQLVMGRSSVSPYQVPGRLGHVERRLQLPIADVVDVEVGTVPPDTTVEELFATHLLGAQHRAVAVVRDGIYEGLVALEDLAKLDRSHWLVTPVRAVARTEPPPVAPDVLLRDAIASMERASVDRLAVCDGDRFVGIVTAAELVRLDEVLGSGDDG